MLLNGLNPNILEDTQTAYECDCSYERAERTVYSLPPEDLTELMEEDGGCEICCHFCGKKYNFTAEDLGNMIEEKKRRKAERDAEKAEEE